MVIIDYKKYMVCCRKINNYSGRHDSPKGSENRIGHQYRPFPCTEALYNFITSAINMHCRENYDARRFY